MRLTSSAPPPVPLCDNPKRPRKNQTITVGRAEDLPSGRGATVKLTDNTELALYNIDGNFYAIENFCPHRGAPLSDGDLCDHTVQCSWHGWEFDVRTGECLTEPNAKVESYVVSIENVTIKITI